MVTKTWQYNNNLIEFSKKLGFKKTPIDDVLLFHLVFGRTVPDLSLNAIANLGYAGVNFHKPAFVGDTVSASSKIIGLKENSNEKTGTVYVKSIGKNQNNEVILTYYRWLMMRKKKKGMISSFNNIVPKLPEKLRPRNSHFFQILMLKIVNFDIGVHFFNDYEEGEIDHLDGQTIEEAEHQIATRLYQNNASAFQSTYRKRWSIQKKNNLWWIYHFFSSCY